MKPKRRLIGITEFRRTTLGQMAAMLAAEEHIILTKRGTPTAVVVPIDWYRQAAAAIGEPTEY